MPHTKGLLTFMATIYSMPIEQNQTSGFSEYIHEFGSHKSCNSCVYTKPVE